MSDPTNRLLELDVRHHELLDKLEELDRHVLETLEEWIDIRKVSETKKVETATNAEHRAALEKQGKKAA